MNRLWVRLQHVTGSSNKGKKRRERERLELRILVGGQLSRLSMLSGLDAGIYSSTVLPRILSEIIACRDRIAQPYLFECTLQTFPVDFTFAALPQFLEALPKLVPDSSVAKACLGALFSRIKEEAISATSHLQEAAASGDAAAKAALESKPKDNRLPGLLLLPSALSTSGSSSDAGVDKSGSVASSGAGAAAAGSSAGVVNVADLDVFGLLLAAVNELTRDPAGPFRGGANAIRNATAASGGGAATSLLNAAGIEEDQTAVSSSSSSAATPTAGKTAAPSSTASGLSSPESLSSLLEVYTSLMAFANACYPSHLPYADLVLEGAAQSLREGLGLATGTDGESAAEEAAAAAEAEKQAAQAAKRKSALSRLTGGAEGDEAAADDAAAGGKKKKKGTDDAATAGTAQPLKSKKKDPLSSVTLDDDCSKLVVSLLASVQQSLGLSVLSLDHYAPLMAPLRFVYRRSIAGRLLDAVLAPSASSSSSSSSAGAAASPAAPSSPSVRRVANADTARRLFTTLLPLIRDDDSGASSGGGASGHGHGGGDGPVPSVVTITADNSSSEVDQHTFVSEQQRVAKLILILGHTTDKGFSAAMNAAASAAEAAQLLQQAQEAEAASGESDSSNAAVATAKANLSRAQQLSSSLTSELDTDGHWEVLKVAAEFLSHGGPKRLSYCFPPLVFSCLQLLRRVRSLELAGKRGLKTNSRRGYEFLLNLLAALASSHPSNNDVALRLSLQACLSVDVAFSEVCEAFASQAFLCYEEVTDSKQQAASLGLIISTLQEVRALEVDKYEALVSRATLHSVKLLKKPDQVRCVLLCSKLFWRAALPGMEEVPVATTEDGASGATAAPQFYHQPKELLQCLQKALSIADKAVPPQPSLFVQCFEAYVGHFERGVSTIMPQHITDLVALCKEQVEGMRTTGSSSEREELNSHLKALLAHIQRAKAGAGSKGSSAATSSRYAEVLL